MLLYAVIAAHRFPFVSGVFDRHDAALSYLAEIPESERARHSIHAHEGLRFPVYMTQDSQGLRFMSEEGAREELARFREPAHRDDEAYCYTNLYQFVAEFRPRVAGRDAMGLVYHHHVTNETLARVQRDGFASLWP